MHRRCAGSDRFCGRTVIEDSDVESWSVRVGDVVYQIAFPRRLLWPRHREARRIETVADGASSLVANSSGRGQHHQ